MLFYVLITSYDIQCAIGESVPPIPPKDHHNTGSRGNSGPTSEFGMLYQRKIPFPPKLYVLTSTSRNALLH